MSIAEQLGTGASFGQVGRRSARGRAKAVTQGDIPAYELVRLRLDQVAPTPLNPRRNFGSDEELTRFGEELRNAQLAACVAVTRDAYLALWPEHEQQIGNASHVLVNGERRYRSAAHVGLESLDFVIRDHLAASREEFIDHLLKENLEREDFDVIERARGVQQLVDVYGNEPGARARAAERLRRDRSWVTNQLALLRLPAEIQAMLSSGELPERDGRQLARHHKDNPDLTSADLIAHWKDLKAREAEDREAKKAVLRAAKAKQSEAEGASVLSTDNTQTTQQGTPPAEEKPTPVLSADNTQTAVAGEATPAEGTVVVLSADNTTTERKEEQPQHPLPHSHATSRTSTEIGAEASAVLSTDNKPVAASEPLVSGNGETIVLLLEDSPAAQAKTLAEALDAARLTSLVEELHGYL
ncbi:ParB/RepB/Spo0J family partition protein [Streptomyces abikoensis]|uniref:ParB/RepB/Spo0J family partition protein n=1 Tax=Streptomyces abikoensis TaxID=97398 RepID=UPI0033E94BE4